MSTHQDRPFEDLRNTLGEYSRIVRHRWKLAMIGLGVVGSIGFWSSQYLPRQYQAATIFERRDDVVLRSLIQNNSPYSFGNLKSSIVLDMTGSRAMANAATDIGLLAPGDVTPHGALSDDELHRLDGAIGRFSLRATVRLINSSPSLDTIQLRCEANDPQIARQFAIALRDRYILDTRERINGILTGTREFFEVELRRYQQQVARSTDALKAQFGEFPGVDPLNPSSAGERLAELQQDRIELEQRMAEIEANLAAREQFLLRVPEVETEDEAQSRVADADVPPGLPDSAAALNRAIQEVEAKISNAFTVLQMTPEHPAVKAQYRKLEGLYAARETLRQMQPTPPATARAERKSKPGGLLYNQWSAQRIRVELELDALRKQATVVEQRLAGARTLEQRFERLYEELIDRGHELVALEQELDEDGATAAAWRQCLTLINRVLVAESGQRGTQFALIEEPHRVARALSPRVASVFAACTGFGLAAAALLVALAELLDRSLRSLGQVTRVLGVPVLASVGVIPTPKEIRRRRIRRLVWAPALLALVVALVGTGSLAYTSLERPAWYGRAITGLDDSLATIGLPETSLGQTEPSFHEPETD